MSIIVDYNFFQNIDNLLRYQNNLLIRKISQDKKWPLQELKKFIPKKVKSTDTNKGKNKKSKSTSENTLVDAPNFKVIQKKIVKKRVKKITPKKKETTEKKKVVSKNKKNVKKKIVKKTKENLEDLELQPLAEDELEVYLIEYNSQEYYLDPKTDKVYEKIEGNEVLNFVGMKEGDCLNLDAESAED